MKKIELTVTENELIDLIEGLNFLHHVISQKQDKKSKKYANELLLLRQKLGKELS